MDSEKKSNSNSNSNGGGQAIPLDVLDDLASRFIINVPVEERSNNVRMCFQIELAHWFYLDFYCALDDSKLVSCGLRKFAKKMFCHVPFLGSQVNSLDSILEEWKQYKLSVPTYGAVLFDEEMRHVLLVQSYWSKSSWGFPKGKVNENEDPVHCATREVYEETGYDITGLINPNDFIESTFNYQYTRLYLVRGVPFSTVFEPRTRCEIKCCEWFRLDYLPISKIDIITKTQLGINPNSFFIIIPFVKRLKKWVLEKRSAKGDFNSSHLPEIDSKTEKSRQAGERRQRHRSMGDLENVVLSGNDTDKKRNRRKSINKAVNSTPPVSKAGFKRQLFTSESTESSSSDVHSTSPNRLSIKQQQQQQQQQSITIAKRSQPTETPNRKFNEFEFNFKPWSEFQFDKIRLLTVLTEI